MAQDTERDFNPEGYGFDTEIGDELNLLFPLTMEAPDRVGEHDRETVNQEKEAFSAWVWHEEDGDWKKHGGSLDPRTGMLLKGRDHPTWNLMMEEEERLGNRVAKRSDGRYYAESANPKRRDFDYVISNAPDELSQVHSKQEGRTHYGLYSLVNDSGEREFVEASADEWYRKKGISVQDALYHSASQNVESGKFVGGWEYYDDMTKKNLPEKIIDWMKR